VKSGFYSDERTWAHAVPPWLKLVALAVFSGLLFATENSRALLGGCVASILILISLGGAVRRIQRLLVSLLIAAALVALFHVALWQPMVGVISVARLVGAASLGFAVTLTTSTSELLDLTERALGPLQRFGVEPSLVGLRIALLLRFTELFFYQWQRLDEAYRVRTGKSGGFRLLAPLTILMLVAAQRVADTLQVRLNK